MHILVQHAIFCNCGIGKVVNLTAFPPHSTKCVTGAANVVGLAGGVHVSTKALIGIRRAGHVGHAGIVGNESIVLDEFVGGRVVSTVARTRHFGPAIQYELDAEINVVPTAALAGNLDPIRQGTQCAVGPAGATVLRQMLIQGVRQITHTIHVAPRKVVGKGRCFNIRMGKGLFIIIRDLVTIQFLDLVEASRRCNNNGREEKR
mmetsp:Transcript_14570/g.33663  ORF Transcript_14570/g.33663 Transcript_14570/m.33663 type:complete len:204 (+) Transcript_14570:501-1112(+)